MNVIVSTFFCVMNFPYNGSIVTIDQLAFTNASHHSADHVSPLFCSSVLVYTTPPWVNNVMSYPSCPIATKNKPLHPCRHERYGREIE
jgi:hypothetical protein